MSNWPGLAGLPALASRVGFARKSLQLPFATDATPTESDAPEILWGTGSPVNVVTAAVGDLYIQTDDTLGRTLWTKTVGNGNATGWFRLQNAASLGYFFVDDFGAVGDGVADDSPPTQQAVLAAEASGGGKVLLRDTTYKFVAGIIVRGIGVSILGAGSRTTILNFAPTANGPCINVDGGGSSVWMFRLRGVHFLSSNTSFTKEMVRLVDARDCEITDISSQDALWAGAGSYGLRIEGRDLIRVCQCELYADQPVKIEKNPNLAVNALDFATFEHCQFAVSSGVSNYNVELADGVTWTNNVFRDCDGARGLGFARWLDTTSTGSSYMNTFDGVRQEQSIAGATYCYDLESTVQQLQSTVFNRLTLDINCNGIKLRKAQWTSMDTIVKVNGDALNMDATCRGLKLKNFILFSATTTGLSAVLGFVEITHPEIGNVSGDRGDADITLTVLVDSPMQRVTSAVNTNRTVTLSATNAHRGARFDLVKTGLGTGTYNFGGLVTVPAGVTAWMAAIHDGSGWRLAGYAVINGQDAAGDINQAALVGGFRQTIDGFIQDNVVAAQTNIELTRANGRFRAARAGSVTGVVVTATEARTAGTLTIKVFKNTGLAGAAGAQLGTITAVLDGTNTSRKATVQAKDLDVFAAGDELYLTVTTDAGWLPVTSDVRCALELED